MFYSDKPEYRYESSNIIADEKVNVYVIDGPSNDFVALSKVDKTQSVLLTKQDGLK